MALTITTPRALHLAYAVEACFKYNVRKVSDPFSAFIRSDVSGDGMNRLYYGDCLTIMQDWPLQSVDLIYLDPPFNSNRQYNSIYKDENGSAFTGPDRGVLRYVGIGR